MTTQHLLAALDVGDSEENVQVLDLLSELKDVTEKKDLELRRSFSQVLELSAEVSKEAALANQEVWEETQGMAPPASGISIKMVPAENLGEHPRARPCLRTTTRVPHQPPLRPRSSAQRKTFLEAARRSPALCLSFREGLVVTRGYIQDT